MEVERLCVNTIKGPHQSVHYGRAILNYYVA